jgi:hypothetical protein
MAWTTPLTAVANVSLTASQWNASVRDNLLTTPAALATTQGSYFVSTGANAIAERVTASAAVGTTDTSGTTTYADLTNVGPTTGAMTTGTRVLVVVGCAMTTDTVGSRVYMGYAVSGATTVAGTDATAMGFDIATASKLVQCSRVMMQGVTAGSNTVIAKYRVTSGTGSWAQRNIIGIPY